MKQRRRIYYTAEQKSVIWERWRKGETLHQIAALFDRYHSSIHRIVAESGGIRRAQRRRARSALTLTEREEISRGVAGGSSIRAIAAVPNMQLALERAGYQLLGFAPGYDREMVAPGVVKRVFEAFYAKVLVPDEELLRPDPKNLSPKGQALFDVLFPN